MRWPSISVVNWGYSLSRASWAAPVVAGPPVVGELGQVVQRDAAGPADSGQFARPAGVGEPVVQVVEIGLGDLDAEGFDAVVHRVLLCGGCCADGNLGTIAERNVPRWRTGSKNAGDLGPAVAPAVAAAVPTRLDRRRARRAGSASPPAPSATTWSGCAGSATRSRRGPVWPAATGSAPSGALPPLLLDDEEAVAVAIGLRTAASGTIAGIEEASVRALAKLQQVLPSRLRHRVSASSRPRWRCRRTARGWIRTC